MSHNPLILVVHDEVSATAQPDALDTLVQKDAVLAALSNAGHNAVALPFTNDLQQFSALLAERSPALVFNLVEAPLGADRLALIMPAILESLHIPYTGADFATMVRLADKTVAKQWLHSHGIDTPHGWRIGDAELQPEAQGSWIVKSIWEHASFGLSAASVVPTLAAAQALVHSSQAQSGGEWFAEQFIDGREFNVAVIDSPAGGKVLPLAEIVFTGLPADAPRIVDYAAKWLPDSIEYRSTQRCFLDEGAERQLATDLRAAALEVWKVCRLRGYARVDFRVDGSGRPWVVDVNCNPCIAPDAGFAAAAAVSGMDYTALITALVEPLLDNSQFSKTD